MKTPTALVPSLPLAICCSGAALAAGDGTIQVRNLTDVDAAIRMDGAPVCTAKAHTDNFVRGAFCSFHASAGAHQIDVRYLDGKTDSGTVSFSEQENATSGNVRVITLTR